MRIAGLLCVFLLHLLIGGVWCALLKSCTFPDCCLTFLPAFNDLQLSACSLKIEHAVQIPTGIELLSLSGDGQKMEDWALCVNIDVTADTAQFLGFEWVSIHIVDWRGKKSSVCSHEGFTATTCTCIMVLENRAPCALRSKPNLKKILSSSSNNNNNNSQQ